METNVNWVGHTKEKQRRRESLFHSCFPGFPAPIPRGPKQGSRFSGGFWRLSLHTRHACKIHPSVCKQDRKAEREERKSREGKKGKGKENRKELHEDGDHFFPRETSASVSALAPGSWPTNLGGGDAALFQPRGSICGHCPALGLPFSLSSARRHVFSAHPEPPRSPMDRGHCVAAPRWISPAVPGGDVVTLVLSSCGSGQNHDARRVRMF